MRILLPLGQLYNFADSFVTAFIILKNLKIHFSDIFSPSVLPDFKRHLLVFFGVAVWWETTKLKCLQNCHVSNSALKPRSEDNYTYNFPFGCIAKKNKTVFWNLQLADTKIWQYVCSVEVEPQDALASRVQNGNDLFRLQTTFVP